MKIDWDAIVREHGSAVFRAAWHILRQPADAEDVTQEVFMAAFRLARTQAVRDWAALLRRLAVCRALDRVRRGSQNVSINGLSLAVPGSEPELNAIADELDERLRSAICQLPEREGEVFCLRYFEDLSNQQIAEVLGVHTGAVAVTLHKARTKLEALLHPAYEGEQK